MNRQAVKEFIGRVELFKDLGDDELDLFIENIEVKEFTISPEDFEIKKANINDLYANDIETSVKFFREVLEGKSGPRLDIVLLNAAAGIIVSGMAETTAEGIEIAHESVKSGRALEKFEQLVEEAQRYEA